MKITVQITVQSDEGQTEMVQEVARLERGSLRPESRRFSACRMASDYVPLYERLRAEASASPFCPGRQVRPAAAASWLVVWSGAIATRCPPGNFLTLAQERP
jgi:hypothetical protein